jgi:arabinofuranan 3-O-arabinosyltransferase
MAHFETTTGIANPGVEGPAAAEPAWPVRPDLVRAIARCWVAIAAAFYLFDLWGQTSVGWTNGHGRPLGDDFINYWGGATLAWRHSAADVYSWMAYHSFQEHLVGAPLDFYHYSYPPTLLVLTAPLAALPYLPALGAWLLTSWYAFYRALRTAWPNRGVLLLSAATPAVFVNAAGGQNGVWTAALFGGGLVLLDRRPLVAGTLFGLMIYKPHLGILLPLALIAGRRWKAFGAAAVTVAGLVVLSVLLFGPDIWAAYARNVTVLRHTVLEDGAGVWHRMVSLFVLARRLGADVGMAYAVQAVCGLMAAGVVVWAWSRDLPVSARNALTVLATFAATPYLQDYDLVVGAFVAVWMIDSARASSRHTAQAAFVIAVLVLGVPLVAAPLAMASGIPLGAVMLAVALAIAVHIAAPVAGKAQYQ